MFQLQAAGMVVHPSPGHYNGTLVNALLHHCHLPAMSVAVGNSLPISLSALSGSWLAMSV